jgi:hypothetical protein
MGWIQPTQYVIDERRPGIEIARLAGQHVTDLHVGRKIASFFNVPPDTQREQLGVWLWLMRIIVIGHRRFPSTKMIEIGQH